MDPHGEGEIILAKIEVVVVWNVDPGVDSVEGGALYRVVCDVVGGSMMAVARDVFCACGEGPVGDGVGFGAGGVGDEHHRGDGCEYSGCSHWRILLVLCLLLQHSIKILRRRRLLNGA